MPDSKATYPGLRVLLVEDYCLTRELTQDILEFMQCDVTVAETGSDALDLYKQQEFDLILMDIKIPLKNGMEVTKEIRELEESNNVEKVPIVALTANPDHEHQKEALDAGMDAYVNKPITYKILERLILEFVETKSHEDAE